jgi:hypothetical protein
MGLTSTQLISYSDIEVKNIDLFEDAFGIRYEFSDVIAFLKTASFEPGKDIIKKLMDRILLC